MIDKLEIEGRSHRYGCGLYEVGTNKLRCIVTDGGNVMPVEGRGLGYEDLMQMYVWGRLEEQKLHEVAGLGSDRNDHEMDSNSGGTTSIEQAGPDPLD